MSQEIPGATAAAAEALTRRMRPRPKIWQNIGNFCRRKPLGAFGAIITIILVIVAIFAPQIAPHEPRRAHTSLVFAPPGASDRTEDPVVTLWLGGDRLGRDVFSRLVFGARVSLYVAVASVLNRRNHRRRYRDRERLLWRNDRPGPPEGYGRHHGFPRPYRSSGHHVCPWWRQGGRRNLED